MPTVNIEYSGTFIDQYELAMAQVYFLSGRQNDKAVFDYFFRKAPFNSGYAIFAGLGDLLKILENLRFCEKEIDYLFREGHDHNFLDYLKNFVFKGNVYSCKEGEVVFANEPIIRIEGNLIEAQLIETLLLNVINFQSLIATKASRIRHAAKNKLLLEFGLRRAQGPGGYFASKAAIIGGFDSTSNVKSASDLNFIASGTMAHSFIQSECDEFTAFSKFCQFSPQDSVLLLDTYSTLKSGLPNAIKVAKEMEKRGQRLKGIRLDSGDLAYLSKECRKILDQENLHYVQIIASNQLDEFVIESLMQQHSPIDVFGVGTKLATGYPDAALDGVYKLSEINDEPKIKLSESIAKISYPHRKQIYRVLNSDGTFFGADAVGLVQEEEINVMYHPFDPIGSLNIDHFEKEPLLQLALKNGKPLLNPCDIFDIKAFSAQRLSKLAEEYQRFSNAHVYKIGLSEKLKTIRDSLITQYREKKT